MDLDAIKQLADAIREQTLHATQATTTTVSSVSAVAFKAPQFWQTNAKAWFISLEASFNTHTPPITQDLTKFHHVIQLLDSSTARRVRAVLENPPLVGKYDRLKSALLNAYEATQLQKDQELLNLNGLGDRKPSELLQHMRSLNHDPVTLFRALFLNQLPPEVRRILAQTPDADLDTLAKTAHGIMDVEFSAAGTRSIQNTYPIEATLEEQANSCHGDVNALQRNPRFRQKHRSTTPTPTFVLCKYHSRFASNANISSTADLVQCLHVQPARETTEPVQNKGRYWLDQCLCNLCGQLQFYLGH